MSDSTGNSLGITIRELPSVHVACITYTVTGETGDLFNAIHECFERVKTWVQRLGYDPTALLNVGAFTLLNNQLSSYDCCVEVPEDVQSGGDGVHIQELPGGRYAVLNLTKDPAIIGPSIGRFYQEYVPQHSVEIDAVRPTYEIYYAHTMDYCVPLRC